MKTKKFLALLLSLLMLLSALPLTVLAEEDDEEEEEDSNQIYGVEIFYDTFESGDKLPAVEDIRLPEDADYFIKSFTLESTTDKSIYADGTGENPAVKEDAVCAIRNDYTYKLVLAPSDGFVFDICYDEDLEADILPGGINYYYTDFYSDGNGNVWVTITFSIHEIIRTVSVASKELTYGSTVKFSDFSIEDNSHCSILYLEIYNYKDDTCTTISGDTEFTFDDREVYIIKGYLHPEAMYDLSTEDTVATFNGQYASCCRDYDMEDNEIAFEYYLNLCESGNIISDVNVNFPAELKAGQTLKASDITVDKDAGYYISNAGFVNENGKYVRDITVEEGKVYNMFIALNANAGYSFSFDANGDYTGVKRINGCAQTYNKYAEWFMQNEKRLEIFYVFGLGITKIESVQISALPLFIAGELPDKEDISFVNNDLFSVKSITALDWNTGEPVESLEDGEKYEIDIALTPKAGYCFSYTITVSLPETISADDYGLDYIWEGYEYYEECYGYSVVPGDLVIELYVYHVHNFNQTIADEKFLVAPATCKAPAEYYYSCTCGIIGTTTFTYGEADPDAHIDEDSNNLCDLCEKTIKEETTTEEPTTENNNNNEENEDESFLDKILNFFKKIINKVKSFFEKIF